MKHESNSINKDDSSVHDHDASCLNNGCNKLDVFDWLSSIQMPANQQTFNIIEVRFKGGRKDFYLNSENIKLKQSDLVVVETTGGRDVGHVSLTGELVRLQLKKHRVQLEDVIKKIYKKALQRDIGKWKSAKGMESEMMHKARILAKNLGLKMKISDVDVQGDQTKATFYYTADGRVDFRELIKIMAETLNIRIEMRQINMQEEASRLGGIGPCGREICYSTWLTDFRTGPKSSNRENDAQWTEFKCCLMDESKNYKKSSSKRIDPSRIETLKGIATLQKTDDAKKIMWYSYLNDDTLIPVKIDRVKEIQKLIQEGMILKDLMEEAAVLIENPISSKDLDYVNVVGQDSISRFEDKKKNKKKRKKKPPVNSGNNAVASFKK